MNDPRSEAIESKINLDAYHAAQEGECCPKPEPVKDWMSVGTGLPDSGVVQTSQAAKRRLEHLRSWTPSPDAMDEINLQEIAKEEGKSQLINADEAYNPFDDPSNWEGEPSEDEADHYGYDPEIDEREWD